MEVTSTLNSWQLTSESRPLVTGLTGEAVAVDVLPGQVVFALIGKVASGGGLAGVVTLLFEPNYTGPESFVESVGKLGLPDQRGRTAELPRDKYPLLVTFTELRDPKSVERVEPDDLAKHFGAGVKLRRITVQITDDPVTTGIEKRLEWLSNLERFRTDPSNPFTNTLPSEIGGLRSL